MDAHNVRRADSRHEHEFADTEAAVVIPTPTPAAAGQKSGQIPQSCAGRIDPPSVDSHMNLRVDGQTDLGRHPVYQELH
jgi:hypothetical protein